MNNSEYINPKLNKEVIENNLLINTASDLTM